MFFRRLKYGLDRLWDEMSNKEDYWHSRERALTKKEYSNEVYFLDMKSKGIYPGEINDGIPVFYLDGKYPVFFYITILNYGLGLLNRRNDGEDVTYDIQKVVDFILKNQGEDGAWRYEFPSEAEHELADGGASGMTQGLAISFLIRCSRIGLIDKPTCLVAISRAKDRMLSQECVSCYNGVKFIEEFHTPGKSILNGSIFALLGLYDYCDFIGDKKMFDQYLSDLKAILPKFCFSFWSYYNLHGMICSKFYQQLHIDQMNALYLLTEDTIFRQYAKKWSIGLKMAPVFILIKAAQKFIDLKHITMNYADKQ